MAPAGSSFKVGGCYAGLNLDKMGVKAYFGFDLFFLSQISLCFPVFIGIVCTVHIQYRLKNILNIVFLKFVFIQLYSIHTELVGFQV